MLIACLSSQKHWRYCTLDQTTHIATKRKQVNHWPYKEHKEGVKRSLRRKHQFRGGHSELRVVEGRRISHRRRRFCTAHRSVLVMTLGDLLKWNAHSSSSCAGVEGLHLRGESIVVHGGGDAGLQGRGASRTSHQLATLLKASHRNRGFKASFLEGE